jgi:cell division protease FtsH
LSEPENRGDRRNSEPGSERQERPPRILLVGALLLGLVLLVALASRDGAGFNETALDLREFERLLEKNSVEEVRFKELQAYVELRPGELTGEREQLLYTISFNSPEVVKGEIDYIRDLQREDRVNPITTRVIQEPTNALLYQLLIWFAATLFLVGILYFFLFRQMRGPGSPGSLLNFGKSKHRVAKDRTDVTLKDVAGIEEAKQDIEEIIAFLKNPGKFARLGGRIPKGVLLIGSPGTGKTLLAKATAGEAGVPFFSVSGSDFVEMFVGVGASRVRDLFEKARDNSPCIIFLDEVDAVGRRRGSGMGGGHDEREQTLNQILVEMDGFDTDRGIIVMAATNRADILDPALLRPGRFDRHITFDLPDVEGREHILKVHARDKKLALDVDLKKVARATPMFSGAELEALLNEAALMAAMADRDSITMNDLEESRDKVRFGRQKRSWKMVQEELAATAYHEAGHALVAALVEGCDPLHKVTVVPRGRALGMTMSLPERDQRSITRTQILARICMAFGGRLGEAIYTEDLSTGASNDIEQATGLARRMVTEWGMSENMGPLKYTNNEDTMFMGREINRSQNLSQATMKTIDEEVRRIADEQYERARGLVEKHHDALVQIAENLLLYETLHGEEIDDLIAGRKLTRQAPEGDDRALRMAPVNGGEPAAAAEVGASTGTARQPTSEIGGREAEGVREGTPTPQSAAAERTGDPLSGDSQPVDSQAVDPQTP